MKKYILGGGNNFIFPHDEYKSKDKRSEKLEELIKKNKSNKPFENKIYIIGYGCIGKVLLIMLLRVCNINAENIILIDKQDLKNIFVPQGVIIKDNLNVTKNNYLKVLYDLKKNDIIVETCYGVDTLALLKLCQERGASHINSCIDVWDYKSIENSKEYSLYYIHHKLDEYNNSLLKKNFNSIISMGCNPGNVSIWNKIGINQIWKQKFNTSPPKDKSFADMAYELGIQTIHISERDTQRVNNTKKINEYCNTWSSDSESYYEELLGPVEASWGTHEDPNYNDMNIVADTKNYLIWNKMGAYVNAQSWVPIYGRYIGNIVRHDEAYTIGRCLTIKDKYNPSVYYVYHPTNEATESVVELKEKNHTPQKNTRLLTSEILEGNDFLGLTYYLKDGSTYFIGSLLDINEAREIYENKYNDFVNATNVQVVAGYLSGILSLMKLNEHNITLGLMCPDALPYEKLIISQLPFLGDFVFVKGSYDLIDSQNNFKDTREIIKTDWTFDKFLIKN